MERLQDSTFFVFDSVTHLADVPRGAVAYCASHGGAYAASCALSAKLSGVILCDAGVGIQQAGIVGLELLQRFGVAGATIGHRTARIGDGGDGLRRGLVTYVNAQAAASGVEPGMSCAAALRRLARDACIVRGSPPPLTEVRTTIDLAESHRIRVVAVDSNALVTPDDAGHIVLTGSHGGLLASAPKQPIKARVWAAVYNDADRGVDDAGISRLPALDEMSIAGACVSAWTARIGDGMSTYQDGVVSALNRTAVRRGALLGSTAREFVLAMVEAHSRERL